MSEQALDLKRAAKIVRRHKILVGAITAAGVLIGGAYATLQHPTVTSTAQVLLPVTSQSAESAGAGASGAYTTTQEVIASSNEVLTSALPDVRPSMSLSDLQHSVQVGSVTAYIISISASGPTAADAEATANAVARSYIHYIQSAGPPIGPVNASLLQAATNATGTAPLKNYLTWMLAGALAGALIGASVALLIGRKDRRLRSRDEIADSIGVPVLGSVSARAPSDAVGWANLLQDYQPGEVDAWRMRRILYQLGGVGLGSWKYGDGGPFSLTVLSLSADRNALPLGPQLAALAASLGIPTTLVIGPQQDPDATATLRAACQVPGSHRWANDLRIVVSDHDDPRHVAKAMLTIVVAVVDEKAPRLADHMRTSTTLLGVSGGVATAEQLARVAANAAAAGRDITGIVVADADAADVTTGRLPQPARSTQRRLPNRMTGTATEIRS